MGAKIYGWRRILFMRVVVIDYGMGNIKSIVSALKYIGINEIILTNKHQEISAADKIILPGVGSFSKAIQNVKKLNLRRRLKLDGRKQWQNRMESSGLKRYLILQWI